MDAAAKELRPAGKIAEKTGAPGAFLIYTHQDKETSMAKFLIQASYTADGLNLQALSTRANGEVVPGDFVN